MMMKRVVRSWAVSAVLGMAMIPMAHAANDGAACEKEWLDRSGSYTLREQPDYAGLLEYWKSLEPRCRGTVTYEARLATIYFYLDQPAKAREAINSVAGVKSAYDHLIELAAIMVDLNELMLTPPITEPALHNLEGKLEAYVHRFPNVPAAHQMLGTVKQTLGDHEAAIKAFEDGLAIDDPTLQKWGILRNLAVSYKELGRYQEGFIAAGRAIAQNPNATRDRELMYTLATCEAHIGMLDDAQNALKLTLKRFPEVKQDPEFQAAVQLVYDKLQEQKQHASSP